MAAAEKVRFTNVLRVCLPAAAGQGAAGGASGAHDGADGTQDGGTAAKLEALQLTVRSLSGEMQSETRARCRQIEALQLTGRSLSGEMRSEMQALNQRPSEVIKSCSGEIRSEMQALSQSVDELRSALALLGLTCQVTFDE